MKSFRFVLIFVILAFATSIFSQTQQGYVKTLGRPDKKGVALSGVSVRAKGEHNAVLSKEDGTFSLVLNGKKNGEAYSLQQVQKSGYELNETGVIGRQYAFSDKVPLTIVMVSSAQLQADKRRIESNAYKVAEKNYHAMLLLLEKEKEAGVITIESYRKDLHDLQERFEKYQSLIDDLADHFAHTDYDGLDEKEREINICIENGELERADSLIHLLFDATDVFKRNQDALSKIDQQLAQANNIISRANADMVAVLKQQEKDAEYLYQLFTIALSRFDNEKAAFYIETRAALDTTNVEWQNQAGKFFHEYRGDTTKELYYNERGLRHSIRQYGEQSEWSAIFCHNIGVTSAQSGDYAKALDYISKAVTTIETVLGKEHPSLIAPCNSMGMAFLSQGDYSKAMDYYQKALIISEKEYGLDDPWVASCNIHMGGAYDFCGEYDKAIECYLKSLHIFEKEYGPDCKEVTNVYNGIGEVYYAQMNYPKAVEYYSKALAIQEKIYGMVHPDVATTLNNIGIIYDSTGDYEKALEYYNRALSIREIMLEERHPDIATSFISIGLLYSHQGDFEKALENYNKGLRIFESSFGMEHPFVATCYGNVGMTLFRKGNLNSALENLLKSLSIREKVFGPEHPEVAKSYGDISIIYYSQGEYVKAKECLTKALVISEKTLGPEHPFTIKAKNDLKDVDNHIKSLKHE